MTTDTEPTLTLNQIEQCLRETRTGCRIDQFIMDEAHRLAARPFDRYGHRASRAKVASEAQSAAEDYYVDEINLLLRTSYNWRKDKLEVIDLQPETFFNHARTPYVWAIVKLLAKHRANDTRTLNTYLTALNAVYTARHAAVFRNLRTS